MNDEAAGVRDVAENAGFDFPLARDFKETLELVGCHHGHHSLLALRHQNFFGRQSLVSQQNFVEGNFHTGAAIRGEF